MKLNKIIYGFYILLAIGCFYVLINFENISHNVFMFINSEKESPYYEFSIGLLAFFGLTIIVSLFKNRYLFNIWLIKAFVTLGIMITYESVYKLDAYRYYASAINSSTLKNAANITFGISGTANVMKINELFTYIVGNSYYSLKLLNSFIAFIGLIFLYKTYEFIMKKNSIEIDTKFIYIFFLFPTILFWSSILGKDPLNLFFIGLFSYGFIHLIDNFKLQYILLVVISIWLVAYIRPWWSIIMVTTIFLYYLKINSIKNFILFIIVAPIFSIVAVQYLQTQGISSFDQIFLKMTEVSTNLGTKSSGRGSSLGGQTITSIWDYLLYYIPNLFTALFRPMLWDIRNPFTALAAIENIILLYLTYKYIIKSWRDIYSNKYLKFYILLIFSWSLLYVIISPTNLGMAARFKLQVLPAMLIIIGVAMAMSKKKEEK